MKLVAKTTGPVIEKDWVESKLVALFSTSLGTSHGDLLWVFNDLESADMDVRRTLTHCTNDDFEACGVKLHSLKSEIVSATDYRVQVEYTEIVIMPDGELKTRRAGGFTFLRDVGHTFCDYLELPKGTLRGEDVEPVSILEAPPLSNWVIEDDDDIIQAEGSTPIEAMAELVKTRKEHGLEIHIQDLTKYEDGGYEFIERMKDEDGSQRLYICCK